MHAFGHDAAASVGSPPTGGAGASSRAGEAASLRDVRRALAPFRRADVSRAWTSLGITAGAYALAWGLAVWAWGHAPWALVVLLPVGGAFLVRLFCIQHDCGHGSFLPGQRANDLLGNVLAVLTLAPYSWWRATHAHHHAVVGKLENASDIGYFDLWTTEQWRAASSLGKFGYVLRRHPLALVVLGAPLQFLLVHRWPPVASADPAVPSVSGTPSRRTLRSALVVDAVWVGVFVGAAWYGVLAPVLVLALGFAWSAAVIGFALFLNQHTFEGAYYAPTADWEWGTAAVEGSAWLDLPRPFGWLTADIGIHHVHHLDASIPHYRLREALEAVPELRAARRMGFFDGLRESRLTLWDPARGRLVSFAEADA